MREEFSTLVATFPKAPTWRAGDFKGSPVATFVENTLPAAVRAALGARGDHYLIEASAGQGDWTHTPWIVVLDPGVTTSVEEGFYVVYLLSKGGDRLYLTLNQGCTTLKNAVGLKGAREALQRRASIMWDRAKPHARYLQPLSMDLNVNPKVWRGKLYERGVVAGAEYRTDALPSENVMRTHLEEALDLYKLARDAGGWDAEDVILGEMKENDAGETLEQAKRYKQHRAIERQASHSRKVKKALGTRCMGCDFELRELYGAQAEGVIDAHHLIPLSSLIDGSLVTFDPKRDFAVLCPNCHRVIHRMPNPADLAALRSEIAKGPLGKFREP